MKPHADDPGGAGTPTAGAAYPPSLPVRLTAVIPVLGPLAVALLPAAIRLGVLLAYDGAAPPGSDGGNWLAFSKELFGGQVKAAEAAYPPVFPFFLWIGGHFTQELLALKLLSLASALAVGGAVYLVARNSIGNWPAAALAAGASSHPYAMEMLAWGGSPQLLGTAFLLVATYLWVRGITDTNALSLVGAALVGTVAAATQQLVAVELVLAASLGTALVLTRKVMSGDREGAARSLAEVRRVTVLLIVLALALAPFYYKIVTNLAGDPSNPLEMSLFDSLLRIGRWHGDDWIWAFGFVLVFPGSAYLAARGDKTAVTSTALCVSAGLVLIVTQEVRAVHLLETGLLLGSAPIAALCVRRFAPGAVRWRTVRRALRTAVPVCLVGTSLLLAGQGLRAASADFSWYRVIDRPTLEALDWIRSHRVAGEFAVAGENERGGLYGWWVEGYALQPTYLAIEDRWLSYRQEVAQAAFARQLTSPVRTPAEIADMAARCRVRHVLVDTDRDAGLRSRLSGAGFSSAFESGNMAVLEFAGQFGEHGECPGPRSG